MATVKLNDLELSCQGIDSLVNNDWVSCEELFKKYKDDTPLMHYCCNFMGFLKAIMLFDEKLLDQAYKDLEHTEKLCAGSVKKTSSLKKVFSLSSKLSSSDSASLLQNFANANTLEDSYRKQIIIADCKLYKAVLTFATQDVGGYLKSGFLQLRSSWKLYSRIQKQLLDLYKKSDPKYDPLYDFDQSDLNNFEFEPIDGDGNASGAAGRDDTREKEEDETLQNALNELSLSSEMSVESIKRLLAANGFGYGLFQILMSFIPANYLKFFKILGFEGDRKAAIKAITITSRSRDLRSPFADLILLWHDIVAKRLFNVNINKTATPIADVEALLEKNLQKYPQSSLFLYYKGKYSFNILKSMPAAFDAYNLALQYASQTHELQLMNVYELGILHVINFDYKLALDCFLRLSEQSKWSNSFHKYLCALLYGCLDKFKESNEYIKLGLANANKRKTSEPVEMFSVKRLEYFKKNSIKTNKICEFMCLEIQFLLGTLQSCEKSHLEKLLDICDQQNDKTFNSMKCLFEGAIHSNLQNPDFSTQFLNESLARSECEKQLPFSKYVQPFAYYNLATIEIIEKSYDTAKQYLNKANGSNFKDYDFENRLNTQIRNCLKQIQKAQADKQN